MAYGGRAPCRLDVLVREWGLPWLLPMPWGLPGCFDMVVASTFPHICPNALPPGALQEPCGDAPRPPVRGALRAPRAGALIMILVHTPPVSESVREDTQCVYQVYIYVSGFACEREVLQYCCE